MYAGIVDPLGPLFNPAYAVSRIIAHEEYNSQTRQNDVALMKLSEPLDTTGIDAYMACKTASTNVFISSKYLSQTKSLIL